MNENIKYEGELQLHRCWCSITFAIPVELYNEYIRSDTMYIYCPLGHHMRPVKKTSLQEELEKKLSDMTEQKEHYRHECISNKIKEK